MLHRRISNMALRRMPNHRFYLQAQRERIQAGHHKALQEGVTDPTELRIDPDDVPVRAIAETSGLGDEISAQVAERPCRGDPSSPACGMPPTLAVTPLAGSFPEFAEDVSGPDDDGADHGD
jgi:hypothetical protein